MCCLLVFYKCLFIFIVIYIKSIFIFIRLLGRIRRIVTFFHRSTTAMALLQRKQALLELPPKKLKIDVCTRWNSTFDMIERYLQMEPAVFATLLAPDIKKNAADIITLSDDDNAYLNQLVELLAPMKEATTVMCEESIPTVSIISPLLSLILEGMSVKDDDSKLIKDVKAAISSNLGGRYTDRETKETLSLSSALDPRFKSLPFLTAAERVDIMGLLAAKATALHSESNGTDGTELSQVRYFIIF